LNRGERYDLSIAHGNREYPIAIIEVGRRG
jgi:hypothetical protein